MVAILSILEGLTRLNAKSILEFIGSDSAKKGIGWLTSKSLDEILGSIKNSEQLKIKLNRINLEFENLKEDTSKKLTVGTEWKYSNTRVFQAEIDICHKFQLLQTILSNKDSSENFSEVELLRNGILDTNSGVLSNLSLIHQELVGNTVTNPVDKGLLEMWSKGVYNDMIKNPMSAKMYQDYVGKNLTKAAILQLKGFLLFAGANKNYGFVSHQFSLFEKNLKSQISYMEKTMPEHLNYMTDPHKNNVFILQGVFDGASETFVRRRGPKKKLVNEYLCGNIEDGKWIFEKSNTFENDGSLLISGKSIEYDGKCRYIGESKNTNIAKCVSEKSAAKSFYVIPIDVTDRNSMQISICKSENQGPRFLGNSFKFIEGPNDIKFTMHKPESIAKASTCHIL